jgi:hypothetical protein
MNATTDPTRFLPKREGPPHAACCHNTRQATCCEPAEKPGCCGTSSAGQACGCRATSGPTR